MTRRDIKDLEKQKFNKDGEVRTNNGESESNINNHESNNQKLDKLTEIDNKLEMLLERIGNIEDGTGTSNKAKVTSRGQLVTSPLEFSEVYNTVITEANTAFNIIEPKPNKRFVITDIILYANKDVGINDATITIYGSDAANSLEVLGVVTSLELPKKDKIIMNGLNILSTPGLWINIKSNETIIYVTMAGYYITK